MRMVMNALPSAKAAPRLPTPSPVCFCTQFSSFDLMSDMLSAPSMSLGLGTVVVE